MARVGVTFEQVAAAADALLAQGRQPTIKAVREASGGSPNTVHKHLTAWRASRPQAQVTARELPARIIAAINEEIEQATAEARAALEEQLVQAQAEAAELATAGDVLETQLADLTEQMAEIATERDMLAGKAGEQATEIEKQREQIKREQEAAEAARVDLATARVKIEQTDARLIDQAAELDRLRALLEKSDQARQEAAQSAAVLSAKLEASQARCNELEARSERAAQAQAKVEAERDQARTAIEAARSETGAAREEAAALRGQVGGLQKQAGDLLHALEARQEIQADTSAVPATRSVRTKAKKGE